MAPATAGAILLGSRLQRLRRYRIEPGRDSIPRRSSRLGQPHRPEDCHATRVPPERP